MYNDKVIWITGASSGIGKSLALEFARQGATVILSARRADALAEVKAACDSVSGGRGASIVLPMDLTDEASLPKCVTDAVAAAGRIDTLINNAGISQRSSCVNTDMATYRKLFEVDVFGQIALTKAVLPQMIAQGGGHLVITASVAGKIGAPFRTGYCAAKHAVVGFFDALRTEVDQHNIQVSTILPGFIRTELSENAVTGDGSAFGKTDSNIAAGMDPDECARVIVKGLSKGKPEIAVGSGVEMHGLWIKRFFPSVLFKLMNKQYARSAKEDGFV
ncbi:SDR family oxidoreductase [Allohahella sp. A8]|uniref:SDR family oxidoreductase n=1 Tax=Allohahella sp. A8 TaxID=3141461 RepID=UPI000C0B473B|nr:short chain dehydrogenase [Hahellaceae bacterium]|tara:strand:+ start:44016 stop:44843 length:828 start_codon:yes stop_codon:yes gene_type:complete